MFVRTVREARAHLSALIDRALAGEVVILGRAGQPVARLVACRQPGAMRGQIHIAPDFDELPGDLAEALGAGPAP